MHSCRDAWFFMCKKLMEYLVNKSSDMDTKRSLAQRECNTWKRMQNPQGLILMRAVVLCGWTSNFAARSNILFGNFAWRIDKRESLQCYNEIRMQNIPVFPAWCLFTVTWWTCLSLAALSEKRIKMIILILGWEDSVIIAEESTCLDCPWQAWLDSADLSWASKPWPSDAYNS